VEVQTEKATEILQSSEQALWPDNGDIHSGVSVCLFISVSRFNWAANLKEAFLIKMKFIAFTSTQDDQTTCSRCSWMEVFKEISTEVFHIFQASFQVARGRHSFSFNNNNNNNNTLHLYSAFLYTQSALHRRGDLLNHQIDIHLQFFLFALVLFSQVRCTFSKLLVQKSKLLTLVTQLVILSKPDVMLSVSCTCFQST